MTRAKLGGASAIARCGATEQRAPANSARQWVRTRINPRHTSAGVGLGVLQNAPLAPPNGAAHDGVLRTNDGAPRCMAAYPSGSRCPRTARVRGMCLKCLRREAPVWRGGTTRAQRG